MHRKMSKNNVTKSSFVIHKRKPNKLKRKAVLKMLAVMEASQNANPNSKNPNENTSASGAGAGGAPPLTPGDCNVNAQEFLSSGRTGRRNALPDILGQHAAVTSSDLPSRLQQLTTKDKTDNKDEPSTSSKS